MLSQAADVARGRKASRGLQTHPPGPGGAGAPTCCPRQAWPTLSPHILRLPAEAGPEMEKLDLSSAGQWLYRVPKVLRAWQSPIPKRYIVRSLVHCATPPPSSSHLETRPGGTWGGLGEALERRGVQCSPQSPPLHDLTSSCSASVAPRPKASSLSTSEMLCAWRVPLGALFAPNSTTHAQTYTHTLSLTAQGFSILPTTLQRSPS